MDWLARLYYRIKETSKTISIFPADLTGCRDLSQKATQGRQCQPRDGRTVPISRYFAKGPGEHMNKMPKYTPEEVKRYLRGLGKGERASFIMKEAANFPAYAGYKLPDCLRGRERMFERLPSVLFQYSQGKPTMEIAKTVSYFSDSEDVEQAMDYVSELIATRLNRSKSPIW